MASAEENRKKLKELYGLLDEIGVYQRTLEKLEFDQECCAPPDGLEQAGADMAVIDKALFQLEHSPRYTELVSGLHSDSTGLTDVQRTMVRKHWTAIRRNANLTPEFSYELSKAVSQAYGDWLKAKKDNSFAEYRDTLDRVIRLRREELKMSAPELRKSTCYDTCLNDHEEGMDTARLDAFFASLKNTIIPLTERIRRSPKRIRTDFLTRPVPVAEQEKFSRVLLDLEGLRSTSLVFMTTEHPFTTNFGPNDVRVTTHFYENNFVSNIFTTLHEGGHALFMQNEPEELYANHADNAMTDAMHECMSRFYENIVGRSAGFASFILPKLKEACPGRFDDVSEREFYEGINLVSPGTNRCDSDELTYCLHIIVRYELEKRFMNGGMTVDQIPEEWNRRYREYLGVDVPDDREGCLQDVHWTGMFGYFPSYALGNAYGAQILHAMKKDLDFDADVRRGDLSGILSWLKKKAFSCASLLNPDDWIVRVTGEPFTPSYYLDYLTEKYTDLYEL
ncbi:MAG: hypothetical protein ACOX8B_00450 [Lachnospiraceae bacterium]|jgi:carboxypeptidase Taq